MLTGNPLNVTDIEVDRDGSIVFTTGGRATEGGVYRLRHKGGTSKPAEAASVAELLKLPQIESAWAREIAARVKAKAGAKWEARLAAARWQNPAAQLRALTLLNQLGPEARSRLLLDVSNCRRTPPSVRSPRICSACTRGRVRAALVRLLGDADATVARRACEAFIHSGTEPPVPSLLKLLASEDRWLRFSARIALERVPVRKMAANGTSLVEFACRHRSTLGELPP